MKLTLIITLFITSLSFSQQSGSDTTVVDTTERIFVFYTYGYPLQENEATQEVYSKWKIVYQSIAGCVINDEILEKARIQNTKTNLELTAYYGADWKERFQLEVENTRFKK